MNETAVSDPTESNEDRGPQFVTIVWAECALALVFVALRLYTRRVYIKRIEWDDWIIFLTLVRLSCIHLLTCPQINRLSVFRYRI